MSGVKRPVRTVSSFSYLKFDPVGSSRIPKMLIKATRQINTDYLDTSNEISDAYGVTTTLLSLNSNK